MFELFFLIFFSLQIHKREGSRLGGAHLELTGDDVTECVGGSAGKRDIYIKKERRETSIFPFLSSLKCSSFFFPCFVCTGLQPSHLSQAYETFCDPRLNYTQVSEDRETKRE